MEEWGHKVSDEELLNYRGWTSVAIVLDLNKRYGYSIDPVRFSERKESAYYEIASTIREISPISSIARAYAGTKHMAVISGGVLSNVIHSLTAVDLHTIFPLIITADNEYGLAPKPSPDAFLFTAKYFNVEPRECLVYEDGDSGIEAGRVAGMDIFDVREHL